MNAETLSHRHVWTAPALQGKTLRTRRRGCGHVYGLWSAAELAAAMMKPAGAVAVSSRRAVTLNDETA
jgi:hypothetical protein